jgi:hypothetical protein
MPNDYDDDAWPRSRTAEDAPRRSPSSGPDRDLSFHEADRGVPPVAWVFLILFLLLVVGLVAMIFVRVSSSPTTAPASPFRRGFNPDMPMKDKMWQEEMEMKRRADEDFQNQLEELKRREEEDRRRFERDKDKGFEK